MWRRLRHTKPQESLGIGEGWTEKDIGINRGKVLHAFRQMPKLQIAAMTLSPQHHAFVRSCMGGGTVEAKRGVAELRSSKSNCHNLTDWNVLRNAADLTALRR
jgi:hypothetical protein